MLQITKKSEGNKSELILVGRLDTTTAPEFDKEIQAVCNNDTAELVLELKDLDYISSAGLRVILSAQKKMNAVSGALIVRHPNEMISDVFDATGFVDILTIEE